MAKPDGMFLYIGTYPSEADARADYEIVKELHSLDAVGTYDAAVVTKDDKGKVHVNKDESATRHGGWGGARRRRRGRARCSPPSIIASAVVGGAIGGVSGHLWRGMSRSDVKELGELIDDGEAAPGRRRHHPREGPRRGRAQAGQARRQAGRREHQGRRRRSQGCGQQDRLNGALADGDLVTHVLDIENWVTRSPDETQSDQMAAGGQGDRMTMRISVISRIE